MNILVEFELLGEDAFEPTRKHEGDAGMDFYAYHDYIIHPMSSKVVKTGVTVKLPEGCNGLLKPKGKNNHLIGAGVIENTYQDEILFKVFNPTDNELVIRRGDSVGQLILIQALSPEPAKGSNIHKVKTVRGKSGGIKIDLEKQILKELGF